MPSSPKSPGPVELPARHSYGRKCHFQRRLLIFTAFVLVFSAGSFLILQITIGPPSPSGQHSPEYPESTFWRANSLKKWAASAGYRYSDPSNTAQEATERNNDVKDSHRQFSRPRVALPQQRIYNEEEDDPHLSTDDAEGNFDRIWHDVNRHQQPETPIIPFEISLDRAPSRASQESYLLALPYAGMTNQFYGVLRALEVAQRLGRTLILPPITTASSHDRTKQGQSQPWSKFLDLEKFTAMTGVKVVELHEIIDPSESVTSGLECLITGGVGSARPLDGTARTFLKQWKFDLRLQPLGGGGRHEHESPPLDTVIADLEQMKKSSKYLCLTNSFKIEIPDKTEWERFGQYLYFTPELELFARKILERHYLTNAIPTILPSSDSTPSIKSARATRNSEFWASHPFITIHARRRRDFESYCTRFFSGDQYQHCFPSTEQLAERIQTIQALRKHPLPVFVATNERRPEELAKFTTLGWKVLNHENLGTVKVLGTFGPMMLDSLLLAHAHVFVGIHMSTFSRVGALRQLDWHERQAEYM
ncbi:hypothetical protein CPC16_010519 [Podila verticillata]|nr:hypothetical protein BGZ59_011583 [Podila verticillata]KAF9379949.1 hypothetical protein CPC16_010519 [Podila verticillata]KAI9235631.1 MAG: GDP-fucose protein O-fucosyltransferase-domain-containing protein [Podila humilis]KFH73750.1 hypothetical protein MVEG_00964 [Podila verticillata NRRL 6337]